MIAWIRRVLGIEDINTRLDHVANRVTRLENDIQDIYHHFGKQRPHER